MTYKELAKIVNKKAATIAVFFSRHKLSIKSSTDINFYLQQIHNKKSLETGKRNTKHLKPYQFKTNHNKLHKTRQLVLNCYLIWYNNPL